MTVFLARGLRLVKCYRRAIATVLNDVAVSIVQNSKIIRWIQEVEEI